MEPSGIPVCSIGPRASELVERGETGEVGIGPTKSSDSRLTGLKERDEPDRSGLRDLLGSGSWPLRGGTSAGTVAGGRGCESNLTACGGGGGAGFGAFWVCCKV